MKTKTILLAFGALFFIGLAMLVAETLWAEEVYEVVMPLPDMPEVFSKQAVMVMVEMGWLRPEGAKQSGTQYGVVDGQSCHLTVWCQGTNCWVSCDLGSGFTRCPCWYSPDPNVN